MLILNTSVATDVSFLVRIKGELITDPETGFEYYEDLGQEGGCRLDVLAECLTVYPDLAQFVVEPRHPIHDCGPAGVRLQASSFQDFVNMCPPTGSVYDLFIEIPDEEPTTEDLNITETPEEE